MKTEEGGSDMGENRSTIRHGARLIASAILVAALLVAAALVWPRTYESTCDTFVGHQTCTGKQTTAVLP